MADPRDTEIAALRKELEAQRNLSAKQQTDTTATKGQWQYIQLPDGSYQQFPAGMGDAEIKSKLSSAYPELMAPAPKAKPSALKTVSAAEQLAEDNRPLGQALSATGSAGMSGISDMANGGPLTKIMGLLKTINAPSEGAGAFMGTGVHNMLSSIPGLGGPSGVVPAAGAAITDAATQLLSGPKAFQAAR